MDRDGDLVYLCKVCRRSSCRKWGIWSSAWRDYDEEGNVIRKKYASGNIVWYKYAKNGDCVYVKHSDGSELWKVDDAPHWVKQKPENWIYEKQI